MLAISFKATFLKQMNKIDKDLVEEALGKMELFRNKKNHKVLKVHKLHGKLAGCSSFSVNYKTRIVFEYETKNAVVFLTIGDHDLYK